MTITINLNVSRAFEVSLLALIQGQITTDEEQHGEILAAIADLKAEIQAARAEQSKIDQIAKAVAANESKLSGVLPPNINTTI